MPDKYIGTVLENRYEIQELVGEGGMADVYKGLDRQENRVVAIKILKKEFQDNAELVRRFKNESRAISVLNHPNIVKVFDISIGDTLQYIVMEYIDGITLKAYIEQRGEPLTYKETVHFISQVLKALQHAHDKGIVHRDVKPQNIMLLEDGSVKVMDFGIARLSRSESHTVTDQAIGSVHYISPEQAKGDLTDPRADIYSLGITMYEMLSGKLPFESDNAVSIAIKQISDEAVPLRQVNPSVPPGLESITMRAMAKDPRRRYQGALEMLRDIEEFRRNPNIRFDYASAAGGEAARSMGNTAKNGKKNTTGGKRAPKKKRRLLVPIVGSITLIILLVCFILCVNIFQNSGNPLFGDAVEIDLPDFVGMQITDVERMLEQEEYRNLRLQDIVLEYKEGVVAGEVMSQNPAAPKRVKENQKIYLVVSRGIEVVTIPDLAGTTRAEAQDAILALGMRPYVRSISDESVPVNTVIGTSPAAGSQVENDPNQIIEIYISSRPKDIERTVPDLSGVESLAEAKKILTENDLQIGVTKEEYSSQPVGSIVNQYPEAGTKVDVFTSVHVTISKGEEPPPPPSTAQVPDLYNKTYDEAAAALADVGLGIGSGGTAPSDTVAAGRVTSQSIGAGTEVEKGTVVTVVISTGPAASSPVVPPPASSSGAPPPSSSSAASPPPASSSNRRRGWGHFPAVASPTGAVRLNDGYYI